MWFVVVFLMFEVCFLYELFLCVVCVWFWFVV